MNARTTSQSATNPVVINLPDITRINVEFGDNFVVDLQSGNVQVLHLETSDAQQVMTIIESVLTSPSSVPEPVITVVAPGSKRRGRRANELVAWGETKNLRQWVEDERCKVGQRTLVNRVSTLGWPLERALSTPPMRRRRRTRRTSKETGAS